MSYEPLVSQTRVELALAREGILRLEKSYIGLIWVRCDRSVQSMKAIARIFPSHLCHVRHLGRSECL